MSCLAEDEVVRLLLGVARLGETDLAGWWGAHGVDQTGSYVLSRAFRRTWKCAGMELDILLAARRHDEALGGRRTALHLFSDELPFRRWANAWLSEQKTIVSPDPLLDAIAAWDLETAIETIMEWAGPPSDAEEVAGGLLLGQRRSEDVSDPDALIDMARHLTRSYVPVNGSFRAPYFDLVG